MNALQIWSIELLSVLLCYRNLQKECTNPNAPNSGFNATFNSSQINQIQMQTLISASYCIRINSSVLLTYYHIQPNNHEPQTLSLQYTESTYIISCSLSFSLESVHYLFSTERQTNKIQQLLIRLYHVGMEYCSMVKN